MVILAKKVFEAVSTKSDAFLKHIIPFVNWPISNYSDHIFMLYRIIENYFLKYKSVLIGYISYYFYTTEGFSKRIFLR